MWPSTWEALLAGRSGVRSIDDDEHEWVRRHKLPVQIAAPLLVSPLEVLPRVQARRLDRCEQVALVAAKEAWAHAGLAGPARRAGRARAAGRRDRHRHRRRGHPARPGRPAGEPRAAQGLPADRADADAQRPGGLGGHRVRRPRRGARAGLGLRVRRRGAGLGAAPAAHRRRWTWCIAGGAEACITGITVAGFVQARTLSQRNDDPERASRPVRRRPGRVRARRGRRDHGAGAGRVRRGPRGHRARPAGRGRAHLRRLPHHRARAGRHRAVPGHRRPRCATPGWSPRDIGHVNCHATSTVAGDVGETRAVRKALGDHPVLTAPKSALGHLVGAAGAVESIVTVLSIKEGVIPATLNLENLDPGRRARRGGRRAPQDGPDRRGLRLVRLRRPQRRGHLHPRLTRALASA